MNSIDKTVQGEVSGISNYGFFVKVTENVHGLVHISEISNGFVNDINDFVKVGDKVVCEILEVLDNGSKLRLSIKNINYKLIDRYDDERISDQGFAPLKEKLPEWIAEKTKVKK